MKKIILSIAVLIVTSSVAFAQKIAETAVPKAVLTTYQKSFKGASSSAWEKESTGDFLVGFTQNNLATSAVFNAAGNLLKTSQEVYITQLPSGILDYVYNNYKTRDYIGATTITVAGKTTYNAKIQVGSDIISMIFDNSANFLSKEVSKAQ